MGGIGGLRVALLHSPQIIRIVHQVNAQCLDGLTNTGLRKRAHFRFPFLEIHRREVRVTHSPDDRRTPSIPHQPLHAACIAAWAH